MKTDKELLKTLRGGAAMGFRAHALAVAGKLHVAFHRDQGVERCADAVIVPAASDQPLTIVEFQLGRRDRLPTPGDGDSGARRDATGEEGGGLDLLFGDKYSTHGQDMEKMIRSLSAHEAERLLKYLSGSRTLEELGESAGCPRL